MIFRETTLTECLDTIRRLKEMTNTERYKKSDCYKKVVDTSLKAHKNLAKKFIDAI